MKDISPYILLGLIAIIIAMFAMVILYGDRCQTIGPLRLEVNQKLRPEPLDCNFIQQDYQCCKEGEFPWNSCDDEYYDIKQKYGC